LAQACLGLTPDHRPGMAEVATHLTTLAQ
jgi:hypothetical protein